MSDEFRITEGQRLTAAESVRGTPNDSPNRFVPGAVYIADRRSGSIEGDAMNDDEFERPPSMYFMPSSPSGLATAVAVVSLERYIPLESVRGLSGKRWDEHERRHWERMGEEMRGYLREQGLLRVGPWGYHIYMENQYGVCYEMRASCTRVYDPEPPKLERTLLHDPDRVSGPSTDDE